jgi:hypothetical protein
MLRKFAALVVLGALSIGAVGIGSAEALRVPAGDGTVQCDLSGRFTARSTLTSPTTTKLRVAGAATNCIYTSGSTIIPVPFLNGASTSVGVGDTATWCSQLAGGGVSASTTFRVAYNGLTLASVNLSVTITDNGASGSGTNLLVSGTGSATGITFSLAADIVTNRPVADLCNRTVKYLTYTGDGGISWDRA